MKILITGGCGFLGSNLAQEALQRGNDLTILDNLRRVGAVENLAWLQSLGRFGFVHADIRNQNDVTQAVRALKPDAIFHLAGQVAMTTSISDPRADFETNVLGTLNVLESVRQHAKDAAVIYSSTNKVYGDLEQYTYEELDTRYRCVEHPQGFNEEVSLDFRSPYGCSKGAADQYVLDYARGFGLNTVVFRHSSMYGGRQFATYDQGWVGWFCQKAVETKNTTDPSPFTISGSGKQVRDVLHARDMVTLYFAAADGIETARGHAFNVGGGIDNSLSLLELFELLEKYIGKPLYYTNLPTRVSDQRVFVADTTKARDILGWSPEIRAKEGVADMIEWVEESAGPGSRGELTPCTRGV